MMQIVIGQHNLDVGNAPCVATIGNYDGVHLGHQSVIKHLSERALSLNLPTTLVLFEPHPQEFFHKQHAPSRIYTFREKVELIRQAGIQRLVCLRFNQAFSQMLPEEFVQQLLIDKLAVKHLVVGDDFRFGRDREGDFAFLNQYANRGDFSLEAMPTFEVDKSRVSSTRIRQALEQADFTLAEKLLGRAYSLSGRISHGQKLGRKLGFPTLNLPTRRLRSPLQGVYVVEVAGISSTLEPGAANLGSRPTIDAGGMTLEVHLLDAEGDFYGQRVEVFFKQKIRDEERFDNLETLTAAIQRDVEFARDYFHHQIKPV